LRTIRTPFFENFFFYFCTENVFKNVNKLTYATMDGPVRHINYLCISLYHVTYNDYNHNNNNSDNNNDNSNNNVIHNKQYTFHYLSI